MLGPCKLKTSAVMVLCWKFLYSYRKSKKNQHHSRSNIEIVTGVNKKRIWRHSPGRRELWLCNQRTIFSSLLSQDKTLCLASLKTSFLFRWCLLHSLSTEVLGRMASREKQSQEHLLEGTNYIRKSTSDADLIEIRNVAGEKKHRQRTLESSAEICATLTTGNP